MVLDRVHRSARILGGDEKGMLRDVDGEGPVRDYVGGVILNQLGWAAALGLRTGICGRQADDEAGRFLRAAMHAVGIEVHLAIEGRASSVAEIFIDDAGERAIYMAPGTTAETTADHVRRHHASFIRSAGRLSTEVSQLPLAATLTALEIAREAGIPTVVDLDVPLRDALAHLGDEGTLARVLASADLLKPSRRAADELEPGARGDALELARRLRRRFGNRAVVVTDGAAGCAIAAPDYEERIPAIAVTAVDTTGAGDAFLAGLLVGLHHDLGWQDAGRLGNACGAACVQQLGAFPSDAAAARTRVLAAYGGRDFGLTPVRSDRAESEPMAGVGAEPGLRILAVASEELAGLRERHDGAALVAAAHVVEAARASGRRVVVSGARGAATHVARYTAELLSETGTAAQFASAEEIAEAAAPASGAVLIAIGDGRDSVSLVRAASTFAESGGRVIVLAGIADAKLAATASVVLDSSVSREGGASDQTSRVGAGAALLVAAALCAVLQGRVES
jgi:ribokinase